MSSKGAKRSRRVSGDASGPLVAGGDGGVRGGGGAASDAAASSAIGALAATTALVRSRNRSAVEAVDDSGGALSVGVTAADVSRIVEEHLRSVQREHARELASVRADYARELAAVRRDHSRELASVRSEVAEAVADARYETSRRFVLLDSRGATSEIGLVCRRGVPGLDEYSECRSVLSVLFGFQEFSDLGNGLMRFFTTKEACELRLVHSEFLDAVNATPWNDMRTVIKGPVAAWRTCFPNAQAASVLGRGDLRDADFVYFRGLRSLDMSNCKGVSDAAFANLRGIDSLRMWYCSQPSITASAFTHLKGIQELELEGCGLAVTTSASSLLQGARSLTPPLAHSPICAAITAADVPECRRLLATRALGSACWLYAGVTFHDLPVPASAYDAIATACLELLLVGLEVGSARIVHEAANYIIDASLSDFGEAACLFSGVIPALLSALKRFGGDSSVCRSACASLGNLACSSAAGRDAFGVGGDMRLIVSALKTHDDDAPTVKMAIHCIGNISFNSVANVTSFVSLGAVSSIIEAFQKCNQAASLFHFLSIALHKLSCFPPGVAACLAAGAVPILAAVHAKDEPARKHAAAALTNLGYDTMGLPLSRI